MFGLPSVLAAGKGRNSPDQAFRQCTGCQREKNNQRQKQRGSAFGTEPGQITDQTGIGLSAEGHVARSRSRHDADQEDADGQREEQMAPIGPAALCLRLQRVSEMARQNEEALDKAGNDHRDYDHRHHTHDLTDRVAHHQNGRESGNGRGHGSQHRQHHAASTIFSSFVRTVSHGEAGCGVLTHNNRVINDNAEHHDQRKQGDHVDRLAHYHHQADGRQHGYGNARRYPEGDPRIEKHEQCRHDDDETANTVLDQQPDAVGQCICSNIVLLKLDTRGKGSLQFGQVFIQDRRGRQCVGSGRAADGQFDGVLAVAQTLPGAILEARPDAGDVAQQDFFPAGKRFDFDTPKGRRILELGQCAQLLFDRAIHLTGG